MPSRATRAGSKLIFHFERTELAPLIFQSVRRIEEEAYLIGQADAYQEMDDAAAKDTDTPAEGTEGPEATTQQG